MEQGKEIQVDDIFNDKKIEEIKKVIENYKLRQREIQLYKLGFEKREDQVCFHQYKFNSSWTIDFRYVYNTTEHEWECYLESLKHDLSLAKNGQNEYLKTSMGYELARKEIKQKIKDLYNAKNSQLKQGMIPKLDRSKLTEEGIKLEIEVNLLKRLMEKL